MVMPSCINFHFFILNDKMVDWRMGNVREIYSLCHIWVIFLFYYNIVRRVLRLLLYHYNKILQHFPQYIECEPTINK